MGFFNIFTSKSSKKSPTSTTFWQNLKQLFIGKSQIDETLLEELEDLLISTDMGIETADLLIKALKKHPKSVNISTAISILKEQTIALLQKAVTQPVSSPTHPITKPHVILIVGVNGAGKTTTIAKLAFLLQQKNKKVMIGAADTFRAAAITQLERWGDLLQVSVVSRGMHKDPGSVAYDAVTRSLQESVDVLLIDTAGRLHTKIGLMDELAKIKRVIQKKLPEAPHETLLIVDGNTGQNTWQQAKRFHEILGVTGLVVTKLDGIAKGGTVIGITHTLGIPIQYIGHGEKLTDLATFDPTVFTDELFADGLEKAA